MVIVRRLRKKIVIFSQINEAMINNVNMLANGLIIFVNYYRRLIPYKSSIEAIAR
jgi:hypothetical protein